MDQRSNWRWLIDWQEASKNPIRTLVFMFVAGVVVAGLTTYYIASDRSFSLSIAVGLGSGVVLLVIGLRSVRDPGGVVARATKASTRLLVWYAAAALGLVLLGAALSDWQIAASAAPMAILAVVLILIRRSRRR